MATNQEVKDYYGGLDDVATATLEAHISAAEARVADDEVSATHARYDLLVILATGISLEAAGQFASRTEEERVADVMEKHATMGSDGKPLASLEDVYQMFLLNVVGMTSNMDGTIL